MLQWHVAETCAVWPTEQGGSPKSDHLAEGWQQVIYRFVDTWHHPFSFQAVFPF